MARKATGARESTPFSSLCRNFGSNVVTGQFDHRMNAVPHWGSHKEAVAIRNKSQNVRPIQCDLHKKVCPPLTAKADHTPEPLPVTWSPL